MGFHPDPSGQESSTGAQSDIFELWLHISTDVKGILGFPRTVHSGHKPTLHPTHPQGGHLSSPVPVEEEDWKQFGKWAVTYHAHIVRERPGKKQNTPLPPAKPRSFFQHKAQIQRQQNILWIPDCSRQKTKWGNRSQRKENFSLAVLISLFDFYLNAFKMSFH